MADTDAVQQHDADQSQETENLEQAGFDLFANEETNPDGSMKIPDIDETSKEKPTQKSNSGSNVDGQKEDAKAEDKEDDKPSEKKDDTTKSSESTESEAELTAYQRAEKAAKELDAPSSEEKSVVDDLPERYAKLANEDALQEWIATQSSDIKQKASSNKIKDAIEVLDMYEASKHKPDAASKEEKKIIKSLVSQFGDRKFTAPDGTERTIKELVTEYGNDELMEAAAVLADAIAESREASRPKEKADAQDRVDALQQRLDAVVQQQAFWESILDAHPDGKSLVKSGKVGEWVKSQPEFIQRLYKSPVAEHGIRVLDAYKEFAARESTGDAKSKASDRKQKFDGLHGESLSSKKTIKSAAAKDPSDDFDDGFEAGSK